MISNYLRNIVLVILMVCGGAPALANDPLVERRSLLNGLQVFAVPWGGTRQVQMRLVVKSGSAFDPVGKFGLVDLLAELLVTATELKPAELLQSELSVLGVQLTKMVSPDDVVINLSGPPDRTREMLRLLGEIVRRPAFNDVEFQRVRKARVEFLRHLEDQASYQAERGFLAAIYRDTAYGHLPSGNSADVERLTLADLKTFFRRYVIPNNALLVISGPLQMRQVLSGISPHFGPWVMGQPVSFSFRPPTELQAGRIVRLGTGPNVIQLGGLGTSRLADDYATIKVLEGVLNKSLGALLAGGGVELAETKIFTPRLRGHVSLWLAGFAPQAAPRLVERAGEILRQIQQSLDDREVEAVRSAIRADTAAIAINQGRFTEAILEAEVLELGATARQLFLSQLESVTAEHVRKAADRYLRADKLVVSASGSGELVTALKQ